MSSAEQSTLPVGFGQLERGREVIWDGTVIDHSQGFQVDALFSPPGVVISSALPFLWV